MLLVIRNLGTAVLTDPITAIDCESNPCKKGGSQHVLCEYPTPFPANECGAIASVGLSDYEKLELIRIHNYYRWYVAQGLEQSGKPGPQPAAKNMQMMIWDKSLARAAQRWVNQCKYWKASCKGSR
ncbi:venom allergen 3 homolog [Xylocopa sonorina]|uniref:venom allergen 3 homolog n=1 Tax=Xylocopa sonorina TaxID=1818115 RepID=UPI00403AB0A8